MTTTTRQEAPMLHTTATEILVAPMPANEDGRGNLAGFRVTCPACGFTFTTMFEGTARADAREHVAYSIEKERRQRATLVSAIRFAHTTASVARSGQRRVEAAARLDDLLADYQQRFGAIVGPVEGLWR